MLKICGTKDKICTSFKMPEGSKIFAAYRAVGYVSNHVPLVVMHPQGYKEKLVVTCIGKSFHSYGCTKLGLKSVSTPSSSDIQCLTADAHHIYTACGNVIHAWKHGREVKQTFVGHEKPVHLMLSFGSHLVSVDEGNILRLWDLISAELYLEMTFSLSSFQMTVLMHPSTYLNKVLLGSEQGSLQLWNLKTTKLIYTFCGWGSPVTVLEQAPAIDVAAIGLANGEIILHNLKFDETVMKFMQDWGRITTITFCTDGHPVMATGSTLGHIALWNLEEKKLLSQIHNAHHLAITGMKYLQGEPVIVTSSPDNTLKMWLIDKLDVGGHLLRIREGHSEPPLRIRFHGSSGNIILSAGQDSSLRSFSTITDMLNHSFGHAVFGSKKHHKKAGVCLKKMPPIVDFTSETTREKEWDNIAACHYKLSTVTTWSFHKQKRGELNLCHKRSSQNVQLKKPCATRRNKPQEPPKTPKTAPFFIPTIPGLELKFALPENDSRLDANSKVLNLGRLQQLSKFSEQLQEAQDTDSYLAAFSKLKEMGPSAIDLEIRGLSPEGGGTVKLMLQFMKLINEVLNTKRYFEAAQAYLGLFLQIHGDIIASEEELRQYIPAVQRSQNQTWLTLQDKLNTSLHLVSYFKSLTL